MALGALAGDPRIALWVAWLLGLTLASKQYLAVLAPLVLLMRTSPRRRVVTAGTALVAVASGFLLGDGYLEAIVGFHSGRPVRTDGTNLVVLLDLGGLDPLLLNPVVFLLAGGLAAWGARRVVGPRSFGRVAALALGCFFLLSSQAFANYWWLILGLLVVGEVVGPAAESDGTGPGSSDTAPAGTAPGPPPAGPTPHAGGSLAGT